VNLQDLRLLLGHIPEARISELFEQHRAAGGDTDVDAFLDYLLERGTISVDTYRALNEPTHVGISDVPGGLAGPPGISPRSRYELHGILGKGSMGEVRIARDLGLLRKVAYKTMGTRYTGRQIEKRFIAEARITGQLDHPNIVPVHALERRDNGQPAYVMRLVQGRTLRATLDDAREQVAANGTPDAEHRLVVRLEHFLKVCDALAYAHSKGVVHRDLKPANVMIGRFGEVYVMDWGLAKLVGRPDTLAPLDSASSSQVQIAAGRESAYDRTRFGQVVGTLAYMAPEQARGDAEIVGPAADQFALGLLMYEVLTLRHPYLGDDFDSTPPWLASRVKRGAVLPTHYGSAGEHVPMDLVAVMRRATRAEIEDRYPSVEAFARDIRAALRDAPTTARPDDAWRALRRWTRHHNAVTLSALVLLVVGSLSLLGWWGSWERLRLAEQRAQIEAHEKHDSEQLALVGARADHIDNAFLFYEGELQGLAAAALHAVRFGLPGTGPTYHRTDYNDPDRAPSGMVTVPWYRDPVSLDHAVWTQAPGAAPDAVATALDKLTTLRTDMRRLLFSTPTGSGPTSLGRHVPPIEWVYVALQDPGLILRYPGAAGDWDDQYDPRTRPWYVQSIGNVGRTWGTPYEDVMGQGTVIACTQALYDDRGVFYGVAGLNLRFGWVVDTWLRTAEPGPAAQDPVDGYISSTLLDSHRAVIVHSTHEGERFALASVPDALRPDAQRLLPEAVLRGAAAHRAGKVVEGDSIWYWAPLQHLRWTYVVQSEHSAMLPHSEVAP